MGGSSLPDDPQALLEQAMASTQATPEAGYLAALEEERSRLARDIHDGPAQVLANALLELRYCERLLARDPAALGAELAELRRSLEQGLAEVRRLIFDLRPPALVELGLEDAFRRYLAELEARADVRATLTVEGSLGRLPSVQEATVFRVVQEALHNVRKHARASEVRVSLVSGATALRAEVVDDGTGFDPAAAGSGRRTLGLTSMRERAQSVGGTLEIVSAPGRGTRVILVVPLTVPRG